MAGNGPPPKRDSQRRRRTPPAKGAAETASSSGEVRGPALVGRHSSLARRWYEALRRSGQAQFYEPSDWATAELVVAAIDAFVKAPSAALFNAMHPAMSNLLTTEGDRRRIRLELERVKADVPDPSSSGGAGGEVSFLDQYRGAPAR